MSQYLHLYRCHCVDWHRNQWVKEKSDSPNPGYNGKLHWELDRANNNDPALAVVGYRHCQRRLRYSHKEKIKEQAYRTNIEKADVQFGMHKLIEFAQTGVTVATIAVMWDPHLEEWHCGKCGHGINSWETEVHHDIVKYITSLEVNIKDWAFGWNCAEVQCLIKAFAKRKETDRKSTDLSNCYFIAYSTAQKGYYGGCRTCQNWIKKFGGQFYSPKDKVITNTSLAVSKKDGEKEKGNGGNNNSAQKKETALRIDLDFE